MANTEVDAGSSILAASAWRRYVRPGRLIPALLLVLALLAVVDGLSRFRTFERDQHDAAQRAVAEASLEIEQMLDELRYRIGLLAYSHGDAIQGLMNTPNESGPYERLALHVDRFFPDYHAFTVADVRGGTLFHDDFGERIGEVCRTDISAFADDGFSQHIRVHPGPEEYHFDVMAPLRDASNQMYAVFFVSFQLDKVAAVLSRAQPEGQHLMLVHGEIGDLVEVTADGARDRFTNGERLSPKQLEAQLASAMPAHTEWRLLALPDARWVESRQEAMLRTSGLMFLVLALTLLLVAALVRALRGQAGRLQGNYQSLVDSIDGVIWEGRAKPFTITYMSPQIERMSGFPVNAWLGAPERWIGHVHEDDRAHLLDKVSALSEQGGNVDIAFRVRRSDGEQCWMRAIVRLLRGYDGVERVMGLMIDTTEHEETERTLRRQSQQLQQANDELEAFSYSVSHDLRAPLRSINGFSQALAEDYGKQLGRDGTQYLDRIRAASERMGLLIDHLLELARVSRSEPRLGVIDLSALAREVAAELETSDPVRKIDWEIEDDIRAVADPALLRAVLANLIGNAWKFTSDRADACIGFSMRRVDDELVYTVSDNGIGFDMTFAEKVFQPFQRLVTSAEYRGTGIGLATVLRVVSRHGGRIWAESTPDKGARFHFTLPPPRRAQGAGENAERAPRLRVIDGDLENSA